MLFRDVSAPRGAVVALALAGCAVAPHDPAPVAATPMAQAEALIDAFYSFDPGRLGAALGSAPSSRQHILYYQGWAQGGNYRVRERQPCRLESPTEIRCSITVKDDLIAALGTGFDVTDTFHLTIADGRIAAVKTSSNDPPDMPEGFKWLKRERPEVFTGPCRAMFEGGTTPQDCVRAVVKGFGEFKTSR